MIAKQLGFVNPLYFLDRLRLHSVLPPPLPVFVYPATFFFAVPSNAFLKSKCLLPFAQCLLCVLFGIPACQVVVDLRSVVVPAVSRCLRAFAERFYPGSFFFVGKSVVSLKIHRPYTVAPVPTVFFFRRIISALLETAAAFRVRLFYAGRHLFAKAFGLNARKVYTERLAVFFDSHSVHFRYMLYKLSSTETAYPALYVIRAVRELLLRIRDNFARVRTKHSLLNFAFKFGAAVSADFLHSLQTFFPI